ncbi:hypothetical protein V2J09_024095 [Rumex salicifolius]
MSISTTAISVSLLHHHVRSGRPFTFFPCRAPPSSSSSKFLCLATGSVSNSGESEESRWLREEQRWLREEHRWLREESRWNSERESLLREISTLRLRLEQLESESDRRDSLSQIASNLPTPISLPTTQSDPLALPPPPLPSSSSSLPSESTEKQEIKEENKHNDLNKQAKATNPKRKALRIGSEGEEVREMQVRAVFWLAFSLFFDQISSILCFTVQNYNERGGFYSLLQEALLKLGFYSGEEDMEFSSFSTGTQRAVKTWQATFGAPEDGIMTEELLNRLYISQQTDISGSLGTANGSPFTSVTENTEMQQTVVKKEGMTELEASHRVFLLGENRWEEPSRLIGNDKQTGTSIAQDSSGRCLTCRGEGRLMCTECDGTGEPNVEPQFLEWVDEGAKCPYCEGLGKLNDLGGTRLVTERIVTNSSAADGCMPT